MYTLHACSASCFHYRTCFPTVLVHFSSRASCHYALTSYHTLHHCSVPVQRTSRQSWLCRGLATSAQHPLPVMLAMHLHYNSLVQDTRVNLRRTPESYRTQETALVMDIVEYMRRGEEGFKNVACVGRGKKPSRVKVL